MDEKLDLLEIDYLQGILKNDPMEEIRKKLREITPAFAEYVKIKGKRYKRDNVTVGCLIF